MKNKSNDADLNDSGLTFLQKAVLWMTLFLAGGIVYTGFWLRNILIHTHFKIGNKHQVDVPRSKNTPISNPKIAIPAPALSLSSLSTSPKQFYKDAQKAFNSGDYAHSYSLLNQLIKTYPHSFEATEAQKSLNSVVQAMLLKASSGVNPLDINPLWHYQEKGGNFFAIVNNSISTPSPIPAFNAWRDNTNLSSENKVQPPPRFVLGIIRAPVDTQNNLYGLAVYGLFSEKDKTCGHPNPCSLNLTFNGQSILADVAYQNASSGDASSGAFKLTNPNQVIGILNQLSDNSSLKMVVDNNPIAFNLKGLDWTKLGISSSQMGHLKQDVQILQSNSISSNMSLTPNTTTPSTSSESVNLTPSQTGPG